jgi:opacity protein-like surface antigen
MIELRHISNPLVGWEATYSYNRDNQKYSSACEGVTCTAIAPQSVSANAHEVTGDWIASVHIANLRPFALAGVGLLFNQPTGNVSSTTSQTKPVFVYGAGLDWGVFPHLGLRFQYRGNLYKAPDLTRLYTSTNAFTHTSEPMIGAYFRY